jgi:hypothetical protein
MGIFASGNGLDIPHDVDFGPDGNLYVSSIGSNSVLRFHGQSGEYLGVAATGSGLDIPTYIAFPFATPIPAVSQWGIVALALLLVCLASVLIGRQRGASTEVTALFGQPTGQG